MSKQAMRQSIIQRRSELNRLFNSLNPGENALSSSSPITEPSPQGIKPTTPLDSPTTMPVNTGGSDIGPGDSDMVSPGETTGEDVMGTGNKVGASVFGGLSRGLTSVKSAVDLGKNVITGDLGIADIGRTASLGLKGAMVNNALEAGVPKGDIVKMLGVASDPLSIASSAISTGILSELGLDTSGYSGLGRMIGRVGGSLAGGPLGGFVGDIIGGTLGGATGDLADARSDEANRDYFEESMGAGGFGGWSSPLQYIKSQRAYSRWNKDRNEQIGNIIGGQGKQSATPLSDILKEGGWGLFSKELGDIMTEHGLDQPDPDSVDLSDWEGEYSPEQSFSDYLDEEGELEVDYDGVDAGEAEGDSGGGVMTGFGEGSVMTGFGGGSILSGGDYGGYN